jgi:hypothetical protein
VAKVPVPKHQVTIFQARYKPQLSHLGRVIAAASELEGSFEFWQTDGSNSIDMRSSKTPANMGIDQNSCSYMGLSDDAEAENTQIKQLLDAVVGQLQLPTFQRLGLRKRYVAPINMSFADLVTLFHAKTYNQSRSLLNVFPENIDDLMFRINSSDDEFKCHITIGPMQKEQVAQMLRPDQERIFTPEESAKRYSALYGAYPEVSIYFDIDLFQNDEKPVDGTLEFVKKARKRISEMVIGFCAHLFEERKG